MSRRMELPNDDAIISTDGRVFYNLDSLIAEYEPRIAGREFAASLVKDEASVNYVAGERNILEGIRASIEILRLDDSLED